MERQKLNDAHIEAAAVLADGAKLIEMFARNNRGGKPAPMTQDAAQLGGLIASPADFWAMAAAIEVQGDGSTARPVALATKYAAAKVASGDLEYIRESLIGQATWASSLAARLAAKACNTSYLPAEVQFVKLALAAQRQAAASLATCAALNKLRDASGATVGDD